MHGNAWHPANQLPLDDVVGDEDEVEEDDEADSPVS